MLVLGALCCLSLPWGKAEPGRRIHRRRLHRVGPRDLHGRPDRPWPEPCPRPHAAPPAAILPIPNKGDSRWGEAWIPVVAPIAGAIVGAFLFKVLFA